MLTLRKSDSRGHFNFGWLETRHTFSFADYYDVNHMNFRKLRVINQDRVQPHQGFAPHHHHNMEIITYVIRGEVTHEDSLGNKSVIKPNEIQRMSAGSGITHSEYNRGDEVLELLQIWILPGQKNIIPNYEQIAFTPSPNALLLHPLDIQQDVKIFSGFFDSASQKVEYELNKNRHLWIQMIAGEMEVNTVRLYAGDGAAISEENKLILQSHQNTTYLLFDLA